jgi:hypothetical protein
VSPFFYGLNISMETIREQLSAQYRFLELEKFFWGDYEGKMAQLKDAIAKNEKIILYHQENINFYHTEWNGTPRINTIQMIELKQLVSDHSNQICVLAHGVHDSFPFNHINHYDFWIDIKNLNESVEVIDHARNKEKDFLFLTRRATKHRRHLREQLKMKGCLENSLYAFIDGENTKNLAPEYEHEKFNDPKFKQEQCYYVPAIWNVLPKQYQATKYSVVAETIETNGVHCTSEKIFKPIIAGHLFVVLAGAGYLSYLRSLGFKTFADHIDESYDDEQDEVKRIDKITDLCVSLMHMDHKKIYKDLEEITRHNRTLFFSDGHLQSLNITIKDRIKKHFRD